MAAFDTCGLNGFQHTRGYVLVITPSVPMCQCCVYTMINLILGSAHRVKLLCQTNKMVAELVIQYMLTQ